MGVEGRDWYQEATKPRHLRGGRTSGALIVVAIVAGLGLAAAIRIATQPAPATYGGVQHSYHGPLKISILPGLPKITIGGDGLYARNDPWQRYLADEQTCPGGEKLDAPLEQQAETMVCLVNFARRQRGLQPVAVADFLNRASLAKGHEIARCADFRHDACGADAAADVRALGYRGAWGENLFIAGGPYGAPRPSLDGWLNSPDHRDNLFRPEWRIQGIAVEKVATFGRDRDLTLWVNQFGTG